MFGCVKKKKKRTKLYKTCINIFAGNVRINVWKWVGKIVISCDVSMYFYVHVLFLLMFVLTHVKSFFMKLLSQQLCINCWTTKHICSSINDYEIFSANKAKYFKQKQRWERENVNKHVTWNKHIERLRWFVVYSSSRLRSIKRIKSIRLNLFIN